MNEERNGKQEVAYNNPVPGMLAVSRMSQNPFAIKTTTTPTRSLADSTDYKESRPLVAPSTLNFVSESSCTVSSSASKLLLRPSALAAQAEKLKIVNSQKTGCKQEDKENTLVENLSVGSKEVNSTSNESNGKVPRSEIMGSVWMSESSSNLFVSSTSKTVLCGSDDFAAAKADERTGFIFGQNLHERVLQNYDDAPSQSPSPANTNLSFQEAATQQDDDDKGGKFAKSLSESAEEYQSRQVKRKFDEVTVITGEEDESNVLQINCKLFAFNKLASTWQERGRGILRLNDREVDGTLHSRVVMRTQGSLRVVLNTKVWSAMSVEKSSPKTVRLSAMDTDGVKVFLIMAHPKDTEQLFNALDWRVTILKSQEDMGKKNSGLAVIEEATSSTPLEELCRQEDNGDSRKRVCLSSSNEGGADSSSEISFSRGSESDVDNPADSTDTSVGSVGVSDRSNPDSRNNKSNS
ncbi:ran-binding protein 3-like isoform X2 [Centruroides sculpturatus]|uniref:ran-binding protein 3-like isoform X2 n=1 Tax=Centruroides sculpturatus TaxID=218467 RepID=UPI000C6D99D3|nr:ran-binding protein 3-like isoform X2 [Centruroides sculpturatus]